MKRNDSLAIIPRPARIEARPGSFVLDAATVIAADECTAAAAAAFAGAVLPAAGFIPKIVPTAPKGAGAIRFSLDPDLTDLGAEGYRLDVSPECVTLAAPTQAGLFYAVQTLRQLLPPEIFSIDPVTGVEWRIPGVSISDRPRFAWRGLMLDTGHDFQRLSYVFRFIELMALHKFNVLHWHLCDLGTFPLEIRGYPELQNPAHHGGRLCGNPPRPVKPGVYTQDEVRAVVAYAAARHITVVPEIDMPGHSTPVLNAYPDLDCPVPLKPREDGVPWTGWNRWEYCLGNARATAFLEEVLKQVLALFPSTFIHIGGDECPSGHWEQCPVCQARIRAEGLKDVEALRLNFLRHVERFLSDRGRRMIGWDELFENGVGASTAIMVWRPHRGLAAPAAAAGHDMVMAPCSHLYFDYPETKTPVDKVYAFEPIPDGFTPEQAARVLGAQAQLSLDNHPTEEEIDRLVYPRACAAAEVVWSLPERRDWDGFAARLRVHAARLGARGIAIPAP